MTKVVHSMIVALSMTVLGAASLRADTKVVLPDPQLFADNKPFLVASTVPGNFKTAEGITAALLTLANQVANPKLQTPFLPRSLASTSGGKGAKPLASYYRGARMKDGTIIVSFSGDAMRYLNSTATIQNSVKGSIEGTLKANFPNVKSIEYEIDGVIVSEWDA